MRVFCQLSLPENTRSVGNYTWRMSSPVDGLKFNRGLLRRAYICIYGEYRGLLRRAYICIYGEYRG